MLSATLEEAPPVNLSSKRNAQLELEELMRKYKDNGGEITVLSQGETAYSNGILPSTTQRRAPNQPDDNSHIHAINAAIRAQKAVSKKSKKIATAKPKPYFRKKLSPFLKPNFGWGAFTLKILISITQKNKKRGRPCKPKTVSYYFIHQPAGLGVLAKQRLFTQPRRLKAHTKRKNAERQRKKTVVLDFLKALLSNQTEFTSECYYHHQSVFEINREENTSICKLCKIDRKYEYNHVSIEQFDRYKRSTENHQKMMEAIHQGHSYFLADCINCGITKFRYRSSKGRTHKTLYRMSCVKCMSNQGRKDKQARGAEQLRKKTVEMLRLAAIDAGTSTFLAPCAIHDMTEYMLTKNSARCRLCVSDYNDQATLKMHESADSVASHLSRKERNSYNHHQHSIALSQGQKTFIGYCINCQKTEFKLRKNGYTCIACAKRSCRKNTEIQLKKRMQENQICEQEYEQKQKRIQHNRQMCEQAVAAGNATFIGSCSACGEEPFKIIQIDGAKGTRYEYHCIACSKISSHKSYLKRKSSKISQQEVQALAS